MNRWLFADAIPKEPHVLQRVRRKFVDPFKCVKCGWSQTTEEPILQFCTVDVVSEPVYIELADEYTTGILWWKKIHKREPRRRVVWYQSQEVIKYTCRLCGHYEYYLPLDAEAPNE